MAGQTNGSSERDNGSATDEGAEDSEKPPPWDTELLHYDDPTLSKETREFLENEDDTVVSREDVESSFKIYEGFLQRHSERVNGSKKSFNHYNGEGDEVTAVEEERGSTDGEGEEKNPLRQSFDAISGHDGSEEERYKSDGDKDDVLDEIMEVHEEERSKSDGDKDDVIEEDDEDAVPLRIQAAQKSNKLTLSNCWLKTISPDVWDLTHLTELDLSANYLKKISKSIGNLTLLKRLRLNHNQLSVLPKEMWGLTKLTTLLLNNNNLKLIPKEIKNLTKLKTLDLSSNQFSELPVKDGIMQLPSLAELRLRNNQLTALPPCMAEMTQLQILWLEGNPMNVPKSVLKRSASAILSYVKDHPHAKRPSIDAGNPRVLRKSPPATVTPVVNSHGHVPGKKDFGILAEKELKKRKREQLEEMRKHLEVEKKVKHLEHELMLANAKAQKYEEEARKPQTGDPQQPDPVLQIQAPQPQLVPQLPAQTQPNNPPGLLVPTAFPLVHFGAIPPHLPRQQGQMPLQTQPNDYKPYPPVPPPVHQQQLQQQQQPQQAQQQQNPNNLLVPAAPTRSSSPSQFEWEIPLLELSFGPRIGRGGYGEVYRGMWGGTEVAVKMLFTDNMNAKLLDDLRKEVDLLCKLRHPNILLFMGACTEPVTPCIVTEYLARGSLASILMDQSVDINWGLTLQIGIDCARGMAYLHSRNPVIIHRDLKTDNLLVDDNWQLKVADFGLATVKSRTFAKTMCGTTGWVAPEVLAEQGYTEKADVYSFAIILWELLTRQVPYAGKNTMQVVRSIDRGERLPIPSHCPPDYSQLINLCWDTDPSVRPPFTTVLATLERMRAEYLAQKASTPSVPSVTGADPSNDNNGGNDVHKTDTNTNTNPDANANNNTNTNADTKTDTETNTNTDTDINMNNRTNTSAHLELMSLSTPRRSAREANQQPHVVPRDTTIDTPSDTSSSTSTSPATSPDHLPTTKQVGTFPSLIEDNSFT